MVRTKFKTSSIWCDMRNMALSILCIAFSISGSALFTCFWIIVADVLIVASGFFRSCAMLAESWPIAPNLSFFIIAWDSANFFSVSINFFRDCPIELNELPIILISIIFEPLKLESKSPPENCFAILLNRRNGFEIKYDKISPIITDDTIPKIDITRKEFFRSTNSSVNEELDCSTIDVHPKPSNCLYPVDFAYEMKIGSSGLSEIFMVPTSLKGWIKSK